MCLSVRPYVSLNFDIFPKRNGGQKEPGKIFKIKNWCPKRGDGGQKEPKIVYNICLAGFGKLDKKRFLS